METDLKFEFNMNLKPVRHASHRCRMTKISNEPKLRQYLVLAYQVQKTLSEGKAKDLGLKKSQYIRLVSLNCLIDVKSNGKRD